MSFEPERRKSRKSTLLYLQLSQMLRRMRESRRPFSVLVPPITRRSDANAFTACSALLLFQGMPSNSRNVNSLLRFFCNRSTIFLETSLIEPTSKIFVEPIDGNQMLCQEVFFETAPVYRLYHRPDQPCKIRNE